MNVPNESQISTECGGLSSISSNLLAGIRPGETMAMK